MWAAILAGCFIVGCLGTMIALRAKARRVRANLRSELDRHAIVWGAPIRWRRFSRGWGESGLLVLTSTGELEWRPDKASIKRGAVGSSWQHVQLKRAMSRRDVSGIRFVEYQLLVDGTPERRFGAFHAVGSLPATVTVPDP